MLDMKHIAKTQALKEQIAAHFNEGDWMLLEAYLGGSGSVISSHPRLMRSLHFGDEDYDACVAEVLGVIIKDEPQAIELIESMLGDKVPGAASVSGFNSIKCFATSSVIAGIDTSLVSVMMPFSPSFQDVRDAMRTACASEGLKLQAADDVWESSVLIQDIFDLIAKSCIVIVDFTGKNPNVMYETGVAHALGKEVVPVSQTLDDVPFDLKHHRVLLYENNAEGRELLRAKLEERIRTILEQRGWIPNQ